MRYGWAVWSVCVSLGLALLHCSEQPAQSTRSKTHKPSSSWVPSVIQGFYPYYAQAHFPPNAQDLRGLTHVGNAFISADAQGNLVIPSGFKNERLVKAAHSAGAKVLIAIGGGGQSRQTAEFASMAGNNAARSEFVAQLRHFVVEHGYDGVQIDWEFPVGQVGRRDLVLLTKDLRTGLGRDIQIDLLLPGMVSSASWLDLEEIDPNVDYYYLMMYDFHGSWSPLSGSNAPLHAGPCDGVANVAAQIKSYIHKGMPRQKMVVGLPFYGVGFDTNGLCKAFKKTRHTTYRDLVGLPASEWEQHWQAQEQVPYMTKKDGDFLWSFDDQRSLALKVDVVRQHDLAGVFVWELTQDIVDGKHQLLPSVFKALGVPPQGESVATATGAR